MEIETKSNTSLNLSRAKRPQKWKLLKLHHTSFTYLYTHRSQQACPFCLYDDILTFILAFMIQIEELYYLKSFKSGFLNHFGFVSPQ